MVFSYLLSQLVPEVWSSVMRVVGISHNVEFSATNTSRFFCQLLKLPSLLGIKSLIVIVFKLILLFDILIVVLYFIFSFFQHGTFVPENETLVFQNGALVLNNGTLVF